uniref:Resistance to inhibitors of cholinesterase protein 3 N-terminal domain-containing protein n=1 Tax=Bubo bubo TaxID=30461 RepID=A0A8C0FXQ5_BUBBB
MLTALSCFKLSLPLSRLESIFFPSKMLKIICPKLYSFEVPPLFFIFHYSFRKLGRFPPRMHYQATPDSRAAPHFARSHLAEAVAKAKAGGSGGGNTGGTGRGLVGQIIPIYGFGIFLYILYILFKLALDRQRQESELGELIKHREDKRNR